MYQCSRKTRVIETSELYYDNHTVISM